MSSKIFKKSEIVYDRLYREYGKWGSVSDFMQEFGQSRQSFYDRKKSEKIAYDEIREVFPDVNLDWLYSNDPNELKNLPVKKSRTHREDPISDKLEQLRSLQAVEGADDKAKAHLLGYLQGRIESLSIELSEISNLMKKLRDSM